MENQYMNTNGNERLMFGSGSNEENEVDLVELFYLLWGHLLQIIFFLVLGGAAAFACTYFLITPLYQASAKMYVVSASNNSIVNLNDLQLGTQLTADYKELLLSRPLLEDVIETIGLEIDADHMKDFVEDIEIENPADTRILSITVTNENPQLAADIANEIARQAAIYLPRIMEGPTPNIYEYAVCPTQKASPSYVKNTLLGGLVLVVVYCAVLVVRYLLNDSFATPEDISKYFGVQPLAVVPEGNLKINKSSKHVKKKASKETNDDAYEQKM